MSEKDVQISYGEGFEPLIEVIATARRPGSWYAGGSLETAMPAVEVHGVGMLSFPVPSSQAQQLIATAAERAPYGKGDQTLVDESVRKVWQVAPSKLKISGKGWAAAFNELVQKISGDLGCEDAAVEAQFYKLLVYEKGGFFLSHRDSEKTGGMFGTLVVTLPSAHEGGDLVVRHAGREARLDLRCNAPSEIRYAAFYADCEHEVKPVRSGFRVCLVFNLVQKKRNRALAPPDQRPAIAAPAPLLQSWASGEAPPDKIVYLLAHHYTEAALSFSALKGADAALAQVLVAAAAQAGCAAHVGLVHIEESGWAEHTGGGYYGRRSRRHYGGGDEEEPEEEFEVGEVCDGRYYIDHWRSADDCPVEFGEIPIQDGEVLPPSALDDEPPDESHFSEATGNEGASFERTYLRAALVIWPEDRFDRICASAGPDAALMRLDQLVAAAEKTSGKKLQEAQEAVRRMARALPPIEDFRTGETHRLTQLLDTLSRFGDGDLLLEVVEERLLDLYDGAQNRALVAVATVLGERRASRLLSALVQKRGPHLPGAVMELWTTVAKNRQTAKCRLLLDSLIGALIESALRYTAPVTPEWARSARHIAHQFNEVEEGALLFPGSLSEFLTALRASSCSSRMSEVTHAIVEKPELFTPEKVLLPALEKLAIPGADSLDELWAHCARHYLHRSEQPPEPPRDWAQNASLSGTSPLIRELEAFARDPAEQVHRFRVRQDLRQELHRAIEQAGLDMTHVTERVGSPQTLVCTKTRATYERACRQYQSDLKDMRRLLALPSASARGNLPLTQRLRRATG